MTLLLVIALVFPWAAARADNPSKLRRTQHPALVQSSSTGSAKTARQTLLKQRTGVLGTSTRHGATTLASKSRPAAKTIVIKPRKN